MEKVIILEKRYICENEAKAKKHIETVCNPLSYKNKKDFFIMNYDQWVKFKKELERIVDDG